MPRCRDACPSSHAVATTVEGVFTAAALVPSPLVLVPELNGADASATEQLRNTALDAAAALGDRAQRWTIIGVGATELEVPPGAVGTFRGFGRDVRVTLSPQSSGEPDADLPVAVLIGGWLRGRAAPEASADVVVVAADTSPVYCAELGAALRERFDGDVADHGVLIVADGANTLTPKAPGSFDPRAQAYQDELSAALTEGDCERIAELDPVVCAELGVAGRAAYQVLAAMFTTSPTCTTTYDDAPYGVGYHVGLWLP